MSVEADGTGYQYGEGAARSTRCPDRSTLIVKVEYAVTRVLLAQLGDLAQVHAGGVRLGAASLLLPGPAGAGKSSLAFALAMLLRPLYGDDVVLVGHDRRAHAFQRLLKIEADLLRAFGVDPRDTPYWEADAREAWYDPARRGPGWAEPAPVAWIVFPRYRPGAGVSLAALRRSAALERLRHLLLDTGAGGGPAVELLSRVVSNAEVAELTFGRAGQAAERLLAWAR